MRFGRALNNWYRMGTLAGVFCLCACDLDLVGVDLKEIASGYRLKRADDPSQFALLTPREKGGAIINEIGWQQPIILFRASGSEYWDAVNTARAEHIRISDAQRKSDPLYQSIQIEPAATAWNRLDSRRRLW
jgi:hypothetical protein